MSKERLTIDNRDQTVMVEYLEARVEVLARRVKELEASKKTLEDSLVRLTRGQND